MHFGDKSYIWRKITEMYTATISESVFEVQKSQDQWLVDQRVQDWQLTKVRDRHYHMLYQNQSFKVELVEIDDESKTVVLKLNNKPVEIQLKDKFDLLLEKLGMNFSKGAAAQDLKAPMPGLIFDIKVKEGDKVKKGDALLVLEAMKMENILKSPGDGEVKTIKIKKGESVEKNQVLIQF
jgi:biotin carboxyl carrier protein